MTSMMEPTTAEHILEVWGKKPLDFDPGTKWQYSNTNFVIAGKIVEQVSGMPLIQFLESRIFAPLGMRDVYDSDARRSRQPIRSATIAMRWDLCVRRPRRERAGCSPPASWPCRRGILPCGTSA